MNDDWRLVVDFGNEDPALGLVRWLHEKELAADVKGQDNDRVVVSRSGQKVFLYVASETQAKEVERFVQSEFDRENIGATISLTHWHPIEERWEDPDVPLPNTEQERQTEHRRLIQTETDQSHADGYAEWEVRIELPTHKQAVEVAERLAGEGIPTLRRWKYLLIGAENEDAAKALSERLRQELPEAQQIKTEGTLGTIWNNRPVSRFAVLGGIAG